MLVVRNRFVAKPGCAGKLAAQLKEAVAAFAMPNARVLTDVTGDFNQVVMEFTAESHCCPVIAFEIPANRQTG